MEHLTPRFPCGCDFEDVRAYSCEMCKNPPWLFLDFVSGQNRYFRGRYVRHFQEWLLGQDHDEYWTKMRDKYEEEKRDKYE